MACEKVFGSVARLAHLAQTPRPSSHPHSSQRSSFDLYRIPGRNRTDFVSPRCLMNPAPRTVSAAPIVSGGKTSIAAGSGRARHQRGRGVIHRRGIQTPAVAATTGWGRHPTGCAPRSPSGPASRSSGSGGRSASRRSASGPANGKNGCGVRSWSRRPRRGRRR